MDPPIADNRTHLIVTLSFPPPVQETQQILFPRGKKSCHCFLKVTRRRKRWKKSVNTKSDPAGFAASGSLRIRVFLIGSKLAAPGNANGSGTPGNVPSGTGRTVPTSRRFISGAGWSLLGAALLHRAHLLAHHVA
jgi:hypothetical protein